MSSQIDDHVRNISGRIDKMHPDANSDESSASPARNELLQSR